MIGTRCMDCGAVRPLRDMVRAAKGNWLCGDCRRGGLQAQPKELSIKGTPAPLKKVGTAQTIDMDTGAVVSEQRNAGMLLPPAGDVCQECAVDHAHDQPHNNQSLYYQMRFYSTHGRWPTWTDAMAHCTAEVKAHWRERLIATMQQHGLPVPADLADPHLAPGVTR